MCTYFFSCGRIIAFGFHHSLIIAICGFMPFETPKFWPQISQMAQKPGLAFKSMSGKCLGSMKTNQEEQGGFLHKEITQNIIGSAFEVYKHLGYGYLEKVYQRAMQVELLQRGVEARLEHPIQVRYKGVIVGDYFGDLFVESKVMVELKVGAEYSKADEAQLVNELVSTGVKVGLLINFGREKVEFKRLVH